MLYYSMHCELVKVAGSLSTLAVITNYKELAHLLSAS